MIQVEKARWFFERLRHSQAADDALSLVISVGVCFGLAIDSIPFN